MKGCAGWAIAIVAWFILWGICMSIGESYDISPFTILFIAIGITIVLGIIGLYVGGKVSQKIFDKKESECAEIKTKFPRAFNDYCKKYHISLNSSLSESNMDIILKESDSFWPNKEKQLVAEEKQKHLEYVNSRFQTNILSNPLRKKYVSLYLGINLVPENYDIQLKEKAISNTKELDDFITNHLKDEYDRIKTLYPEGLDYFQVQNDDVDFGDKLENEDFYDSCVDSEQLIKEKQEICDKYVELVKKYPNGIKGYEDSHILFDDNLCRSYKPSKDEIIQLGETKLAELEQLSSLVERGKKWISAQQLFASNLRNNYDKYIPHWGCYFYDLSIETPSFHDKPQLNNFRIWQFFYSSYCDDIELDYSLTPDHLTNFLYNTDFLSKERKYKDIVYDKILSFIRFIKSQNQNVCVLFGDSECTDSTINEYQFSYLRLLLPIENIPFFDKVLDIDVPENSCIIVIELVSSNSHLRNLCYEITGNPKIKSPNISYISLRKGYDTSEMSEIIESAKRNKEIQEQKQKLHYDLKSCVSSWPLTTKSQLHCFSLYYYYPVSCGWDASEAEWDIRNLIWDFKASPHHAETEKETTRKQLRAIKTVFIDLQCALTHFFGNLLPNLTLVCLPASTKQATIRRFKSFSDLVCRELGMINGFDYINITKDGLSKRDPNNDTGHSIPVEVSIDKDFFKGKYVLLFDDVITSGSTIELFKLKLENVGASVIGAVSVGRTKHERQTQNPIDCI